MKLGFTLIELAVTISLIILISAVSFYQHRSLNSNSNLISDAIEFIEVIKNVQEKTASGVIPDVTDQNLDFDTFGTYKVDIPITSEGYRINVYYYQNGVKIENYAEEINFDSKLNAIKSVKAFKKNSEGEWIDPTPTENSNGDLIDPTPDILTDYLSGSGNLIIEFKQPEYIPHNVKLEKGNNSLNIGNNSSYEKIEIEFAPKKSYNEDEFSKSVTFFLKTGEIF